MKKQLLAGLLAGCVAMSGCASMLERDYVSVTPHSSTRTDVGSSSVLRVENYQELVNSLIYFISHASDSGVIRLYMDSGVVEEHLHSARQEILSEYPLAVYALEDISFESDPLVTYVETRVEFSYRRTPQQVTSIVSASGISAVRSVLSDALKEFSRECVMDISYFDQDEAFVRSLIHQAYYAAPATALEFPELDIFIYPDSGRQRIVEVLFHYETDLVQLSQQAELLKQASQNLAESLRSVLPSSETALRAARAVLAEGGYKTDGGPTAYHALLNDGANSEGLSLAMAAVCGELGLPCKVAYGQRSGEPHFWNVVYTEIGWRHIDLSDEESLGGLHTDKQWHDSGYQWEETSLPACG